MVDLRFIPDEVSFEEDVPRLTKTRRQPDVCKMMPKNYEAPEFVTSALTRSKVSLTWDETDSRRRTLLRKGDFEEDQVKYVFIEKLSKINFFNQIQWVRPMGNTRALRKSVAHWSHT